jgi:hypothetical protein
MLSQMRSHECNHSVQYCADKILQPEECGTVRYPVISAAVPHRLSYYEVKTGSSYLGCFARRSGDMPLLCYPTNSVRAAGF